MRWSLDGARALPEISPYRNGDPTQRHCVKGEPWPTYHSWTASIQWKYKSCSDGALKTEPSSPLSTWWRLHVVQNASCVTHSGWILFWKQSPTWIELKISHRKPPPKNMSECVWVQGVCQSSSVRSQAGREHVCGGVWHFCRRLCSTCVSQSFCAQTCTLCCLCKLGSAHLNKRIVEVKLAEIQTVMSTTAVHCFTKASFLQLQCSSCPPDHAGGHDLDVLHSGLQDTSSSSAAKLKMILLNARLLPFLLLGRTFQPSNKDLSSLGPSALTAFIVSINPSGLCAVRLQTCCFSQRTQGNRTFVKSPWLWSAQVFSWFWVCWWLPAQDAGVQYYFNAICWFRLKLRNKNESSHILFGTSRFEPWEAFSVWGSLVLPSAFLRSFNPSNPFYCKELLTEV